MIQVSRFDLDMLLLATFGWKCLPDDIANRISHRQERELMFTRGLGLVLFLDAKANLETCPICGGWKKWDSVYCLACRKRDRIELRARAELSDLAKEWQEMQQWQQWDPQTKTWIAVAS